MAWQAPRTFTTGELITGAILNQEIRDNLEAIVGSSTLHGKISGQLLQRVDLAADGTITLDNIVPGFSELEIRYSIRSDAAASLDGLSLHIDGDTTETNYHTQTLEGRNGANASGEAASSQAAIISASSAPANSFGTGKIHLINYDEVSRIKTVVSQHGVLYGAGAINTGHTTMVHEDGSTGVIDTSLVLGAGVDLLVAGSWAELWGH